MERAGCAGHFHQYAPMVAEREGTLNHATSGIELKPTSEIIAKSYASSVFTAEVGDFLNEIERSGLVEQAFPPAGLD